MVEITRSAPPPAYPAAGKAPERSVAAQEFKQGDRVKWNTPHGETHGKVRKRITSQTGVNGQKVNASDDDPRYVVGSEKGGNEAAHEPDSLGKA